MSVGVIDGAPPLPVTICLDMRALKSCHLQKKYTEESVEFADASSSYSHSTEETLATASCSSSGSRLRWDEDDVIALLRACSNSSYRMCNRQSRINWKAISSTIFNGTRSASQLRARYNYLMHNTSQSASDESAGYHCSVCKRRKQRGHVCDSD